MKKVIPCLIGLFALALPAHAQLAIDFYTIDGGGGTSSGGSYTISGTIGQPDASTTVLSGGSYELRGGFWHAAVPEPCTADWNGNNIVNTSDFVAYLNDFNAVQGGGSFTYNDPDIAPPIGVLNTADFVAYLNAYNTGCP